LTYLFPIARLLFNTVAVEELDFMAGTGRDNLTNPLPTPELLLSLIRIPRRSGRGLSFGVPTAYR
jgi:hypothetical protein